MIPVVRGIASSGVTVLMIEHVMQAVMNLAEHVWVLAQGQDIVPIPGTTRRVHLAENLAALDFELTAEDLDRIEEVAPVGVAAGLRYPEASLKHING